MSLLEDYINSHDEEMENYETKSAKNDNNEKAKSNG